MGGTSTGGRVCGYSFGIATVTVEVSGRGGALQLAAGLSGISVSTSPMTSLTAVVKSERDDMNLKNA